MEHVLLSLLGSQEETERHWAINEILEIRGENLKGDPSVRDFHVPDLNWNADCLKDLIDWTGPKSVYEPILTACLSSEELKGYLDKPFTVGDIQV